MAEGREEVKLRLVLDTEDAKRQLRELHSGMTGPGRGTGGRQPAGGGGLGGVGGAGGGRGLAAMASRLGGIGATAAAAGAAVDSQTPFGDLRDIGSASWGWVKDLAAALGLLNKELREASPLLRASADFMRQQAALESGTAAGQKAGIAFSASTFGRASPAQIRAVMEMEATLETMRHQGLQIGRDIAREFRNERNSAGQFLNMGLNILR